MTPPKGKSYSSGSNPATPSTGPPRKGVDSAAAVAQQKVNTAASYKKQDKPAPAWKDPKTGKEREFTPIQRKQVDQIRSTVTHERYVTYEHRVSTFYAPYYHQPVVYYSDPFGPFFWLWLLERQSADQRAMWYYNHQAVLQQSGTANARLAELRAKDAEFDARLRRLEGRAADPTYVPTELKDQPELMYNKNYVDAAYNPTPAVYHPAPSGGSVVFWTLVFIFGGMFLGFLVWFVFIREVPGY